MPIRCNGNDDRLTKGLVPFTAVIKGEDEVVYGAFITPYLLSYPGKIPGIKSYTITKTYTNHPNNRTGVIVQNPPQAGSISVYFGDIIEVELETEEGYIQVQPTFSLSGGKKCTVTGNVSCNIPSPEVISWSIGSNWPKGIQSFKVSRQPSIGPAKSSAVFDSASSTIQVYYGDTVTISDVEVSEGYISANVTVPEEPITSNFVIDVLTIASIKQLTYPAKQDGVSIHIYNGSEIQLSDDGGVLSIPYDSNIDIIIEREPMYYNSEQACVVNGENIEASLDSNSFIGMGDDEAQVVVSRATFSFSVNGNVALSVTAGLKNNNVCIFSNNAECIEQVALYSPTSGYWSGTFAFDGGTQYLYSGDSIAVKEGDIINSSYSKKDGYKISSVKLSCNGKEYLFGRNIVGKYPCTIDAEYVKGVERTVTMPPSFAGGSIEILQAETEYSDTPKNSYSGGPSITVYDGDKVLLSYSRTSGYTNPSVYINGNKVEFNEDKQYEITVSENMNITVEPGVAAEASYVLTVNNVSGWLRNAVNVESEYMDGTLFGGNYKSSSRSYTIYKGDKILSVEDFGTMENRKSTHTITNGEDEIILPHIVSGDIVVTPDIGEAREIHYFSSGDIATSGIFGDQSSSSDVAELRNVSLVDGELWCEPMAGATSVRSNAFNFVSGSTTYGNPAKLNSASAKYTYKSANGLVTYDCVTSEVSANISDNIIKYITIKGTGYLNNVRNYWRYGARFAI